ncbi:hypothetical protein [Acidaminobacter hydrogenoformans]|uniref:Uncharacterized protein n=1 Tax=Acidaminobacter hydrogenoformans DSM 2784 TaxID=1120920 RepID=A0A1G5RWH2_9FIRM|nr:hypothetical protein [Acidaminobacter hydrogenoformans]SCZ78462.1 hypothetical protein SAMN03080599_01277 [Acidaminobacter hydrogenoformans DSM 2784]
MCGLNDGTTDRCSLRRRAGLILLLLITGISLFFSGCIRNQEAPNGLSGTETSADSETDEQTVDGDERPSANAPLVSADPLQSKPVPDLAALPVIKSPEKFHALYLNPIEVLTTQEEVPGTLWKSTVQISGLRDEIVQKAINEDLSRLYSALMEDYVPPYRGIYQRIPPGTPPVTMNLNAFVAFNFENLLSVVIYCDKTYDIQSSDGEESTKPKMQEYASRVETRNYDLRTGRDVALAELFSDPPLAMEKVNSEVAKLLSAQQADEEPGFDMGMRWAPALTTAFKGLTPDQKFYLQPTGITLVLDHHTPAFDTGFHPAHLSLSFAAFEGGLALRQRFASSPGANIYRDTGPRDQQFVQSGTFSSEHLAAGDEGGFNPTVNTHLSYRYPTDLPAPLLTLATTAVEESRQFLKTLEFTGTLRPGEEPYCEISLDVIKVGPFTTLRHAVYTNAPVKDAASDEGVRPAINDAFSLRKSLPQSHAQNPIFFTSFYADGRQITLEDCFQPGLDYDALLTDAYNKQALQYGYPTVEKSQLANPMLSIGHTGLECYFPELGDYGYMNLPYEDLGSEHLTIFD